MDNFTSYFIGLPLPVNFKDDFNKLLNLVNTIIPEAQTIFPDTPHITLFYLIESSENNLEKISKIIKTHLKYLFNVQIEISGLGYFAEDDPRVIFLNVLYPSLLVEFFNTLSTDLNEFSAKDNDFPFHPHLTIATLKTRQAKYSFLNGKNDLGQVFNTINWKFIPKELIIYGANSNKIPEYQKKLKIMLIK